MTFRALLVLALLSVEAGAAPASFDHCVNALYKSGGLSLRESQVQCLQFPQEEVLSCQNNLFQIAYKTPQESLARCLRDPQADSFYRGDLYRGVFEELPSGQKKTVCSVTVNSKEEKESFRRMLPVDQYDFVELLPQTEAGRFVTRDNFWLQRACEQQVRCDILVFSGHFAESFIGDTGFEISMQDLKKFKQQPACGNFFGSIQEVYLFGCNTLATKTADHRSIRQYVQILVEDGVSPHTAQRIAARRYTKYDHSVAQKMGEIFSEAAFVTGFPSVGPTGRRVQPTLEKYLGSAFQDEGQGTADKVKAFRSSLGRLGMIQLSAKKTNPVRSEGSLLQDSRIKTLADVNRYTSEFALDLPVAVVDLLTLAEAERIVPSSEMHLIRQSLKVTWDQMSIKDQTLSLCPLILAGHEEWVPKNLNCRENTEWLSWR